MSEHPTSGDLGRISISEDDLAATPVVYSRVAGAGAEIYAPVDSTVLNVQETSKVATWVLVVGALVLAAAFGVGGFVLGQSGRITQHQLEVRRAADRAHFEADQRSAVNTAVGRARRQAQTTARHQISVARAEGVAKGRRIGRRDALDQLQNAAPEGSITTDDCLTAVQFCDE